MEDRIEFLKPNEPRIDLKDHKKNFQENATYRFICPAKSDIRRISKFIIDAVLSLIISNLPLKVLFDTDHVISWFKSMEKICNY